jgi:hypothetical protein
MVKDAVPLRCWHVGGSVAIIACATSARPRQTSCGSRAPPSSQPLVKCTSGWFCGWSHAWVQCIRGWLVRTWFSSTRRRFSARAVRAGTHESNDARAKEHDDNVRCETKFCASRRAHTHRESLCDIACTRESQCRVLLALHQEWRPMKSVTDHPHGSQQTHAQRTASTSGRGQQRFGVVAHVGCAGGRAEPCVSRRFRSCPHAHTFFTCITLSDPQSGHRLQWDGDSLDSSFRNGLAAIAWTVQQHLLSSSLVNVVSCPQKRTHASEDDGDPADARPTCDVQEPQENASVSVGKRSFVASLGLGIRTRTETAAEDSRREKRCAHVWLLAMLTGDCMLLRSCA